MHKNLNFKMMLCVALGAIILFAQISNVAAANNQGLEWGIEVDDRFDYDFEVSYHNSTFNLELTGEMYIIIDEVYSISDDITALMNIPILNLWGGSYTTYWSNDTVMDDFWLGIPYMGSTFIAYPIGNWSLMTELFEDAAPSCIITQDTSILNNTIVDVPNTGNVMSYVLQKINGVAISSHWDVSWGDTTAVVTMSIIQSSTSTQILFLGGGVAVTILVVIVIVLLRRK